jgi:hypothetical protein
MGPKPAQAVRASDYEPLNGIINLGNPLKDMRTICPSACSQPTQTTMKITGARIFSSGELFVTSPLYGAGTRNSSRVARSGTRAARARSAWIGLFRVYMPKKSRQ